MTEYRRGKSSIPKPLKDYAVPILALFLILIIIYSVFSGGSNKKVNSKNTNIEAQSDGVSVTFNSDNTDASIEYPSGDKKQIDNNSMLYKGEKLIIKQGSVSFKLGNDAELNLDKLGILKYKEDGTIYLDSSSLWVKANNNINIAMKFANVSIKQGSVVDLNQNDVESTIYVLKGMAEVSNLAGVSTVVGKGQKVGVLVQNASSKDIDLSSLKTDLDDYFKLSDWFIQNSGDSYLKSNLETSSTGGIVTSTGTISLNGNNKKYISFNNISDGAYISDDQIDITGKIIGNNVSKITVGDYIASIDKQNKTFIIKGVSLDQNTNDLVFKVYDNDGNMISRFVYTIYRNGVNSKTLNNSNKFSVTNYKIDASKFVFTAPSTSGIYKTFDTFVTIKGSVPKGVGKVVVDGYNLKSFNGITWRYHASVDFNNLKVGTNQYEIKYYDRNGKLIFKNYYTIILESKNMNSKLISDEVKPTKK